MPATGRWTAAIGAALAARLELRVHQLDDPEYWKQHTRRLQLGVLRRNLTRARSTEIGRAFGFAALAALPDDELLPAYRNAVPVRDYEGYRDACRRMREDGQRGVLWPGLVRDFAQTSGTTAGDKYMPVSRDMLRSNYLCSLDIFAHARRRGHRLSDLFAGRCLFLGGSSDLTTNAHGVNTGDLSGIVTPLITWPISEVYSPGPEIALESHWPTKIDKMARLSMTQDIRMLSGMPSWAGVLMDRVLELTGADRVADVWPNLRLFVHGGVRYDPFQHSLAQKYSAGQHDDLPDRLELYPASEAFVAIQDEPGDRGLRLCVDRSNFFEFVPADQINTDQINTGQINSDAPDARAAWEVEKNTRYVVVLSTCAGLFRYVLGDVVEFDTLADEGPVRLRIVGRHKHFINAFGENLIVEHIENAVAEAAAATGLAHGEFTAAPVYQTQATRPGLELAIETAAISPAALAAFADRFDRSLKDQNADYETKRTDSLGMAPPTITPLAAGAFHRWLDDNNKLGGQHKCPRCANNRDLIDQLTTPAGTP
ncbi:MAG: GH3 auxin-responsive promoter family protein [Planctomycetota bacterium]